MKDYYQILRISRLASDAEIKRAYRRLAVVFHPDKNQSPESSSLFQEINEAHEVLSDPVKRALYNQLLTGAVPVDMPPPRREHPDPAYRRRQAAGYQPRPSQPSERLLMMAHLLRYYRMICLIGLGWCAFLMIDYSLPSRVSIEKVVSEVEAIEMREGHHGYVVGTTKGHQFPVSAGGVKYFPPGSEASVITSRLLNVIVRVTSQDQRYSITSLVSVYQNFLFMPAVLFVLSLIAIGQKSGIEFRFSFMVAICMFLFFNIIFLAKSILWI